jgi:hypothetical protein
MKRVLQRVKLKAKKTAAKLRKKYKAVPVSKFGKDHWSTFGYIHSVVVGQGGVPDRDRMRVDADLHPGLVGPQQAMVTWKRKYPTRLKGGVEKRNHDDWSAAEDLVVAGLIEWRGTGIDPVFKLTDLGWEIGRQLSDYKQAGGNFAAFEPKFPELAGV